jgi:drug/metabolite transporter (DMT)-like permease
MTIATKILRHEDARAYLILVAGAIAISFSPVWVKLLGRKVLGTTAIAFWRTFIGGAILVLIAVLQKQRLRLAAVPMAWCIFTGLCFALDLSIWHRAILYIGAGMSTLIGNTQVFATSAMSHLVFKEKLTRRFLVAAPVAFFGLAMLVGVFSKTVEFTPLYIRGVIYSFGTAAMYALYMLGLKKASDHNSNPAPATSMAWICLTAAVFLAIGSALEEGAFWPPDFRAFFVLMVLGVIGQAIAWWGIATAMKRVAIHYAAFILLMQPTLAMIWGFLFFSETLGLEQVVGAAITLSAIYAGSIKKVKPTSE